MTAAPTLTCYRLTHEAPAIVPAKPKREWMDATAEKYAYRCLPLSIANSSGWVIESPWAFEATWNGETGKDAISFEYNVRTKHFVLSHFGHGILTFHVGWLFRTSPGWAIWARGCPNKAKADVTPLEGVIETDWLQFPFTMNWRITTPNVPVRFEQGEPICFLTLLANAAIDQVQPELRDIDDNPELAKAYRAASTSRQSFNAALRQRRPEAVAQGWQKTYPRGEGVDAVKGAYHITKRRLKEPRGR